ncbi:MAG: helix-turn-helix transcriptional regulator [Gemmatimonadaceae bacterium]
MSTLEQVFSVFLSPFASSIEDWRDRSSTAFKELLGADYSMYSEYTIGQMAFQVADAPPAGMERMEAIGAEMASAEPTHPLVHRLMTLERTGQLPVYTTPLLNSVLEGQFAETPFYRDIMQPAGMEHIAGLVSVGGTATRRLTVGWHRKRRITPGARVLGTLRLLHPAFEAACGLIDQAELARRALLTTIDESTDGMTLIVPDGTALHRNPALRRMIALEGESGALQEAILAITERRTQGAELTPNPTGETHVCAAHGRFTVKACVLATTFGIPPNTMLVTLTDVSEDLPLVGEIQRTFALTRRQAEVARMLAGRLSDAEIAARLGLSWHTVRSHVDRVFSAMRVRSRQEIVERVRGIDSGH